MQSNHQGSPYAQPSWTGANYAASNPHASPYPHPHGAAGPAGPGMYRENVFVPYGAVAGPLVNPMLRKMKLALGILQLLAFGAAVVGFIAAGVLGEDDSSVPLAVGLGFIGLWYLLLMGSALANMIWIYQLWSWFPPEQRWTGLWKKYISPGAAVGFLLIPYFNIFWMFVVHMGIADVLERMRVQYPTGKGSAKNLAIAATVVPMLFFPAAPFVQYFFAKHVEQMASDMHARRAPR